MTPRGPLGPGWLPRYRPRGLRRPTLAYTRMRRRSPSRTIREANSTAPVNNEIVLFDHGPTEFPIATARPRELRSRAIAMVAHFQLWLAERWAWLRPRTVPCAVAALGMIAVLASADYLAHANDDQGTRSTPYIHIDLVGR